MSSTKKYLLIACWQFFIFFPVFSFSQAPKLKFKHITNEQGLSNTTVESIFQDNRGFMWFGTRDGLNRYDGYQVSIYRHDSKDSNSISDNFIQYIYEDARKELWIGTSNGLNKFNAVQNKFTRYKHNPAFAKTISSNYITCIYEDRKNRLWVTTLGGGINLFHPNEGQFTAYRHHSSSANSLNSDNVNYIFEDSRENCWVATDKGLQLFNRELATFQTIDILPGESNTVKNYSIRLIKEDKTGNLLLGTSDNGIILFNAQFKTFRQYTHKETEPLSLASNLIRSILVSKNGNIWTGGVNGGLNLFDPVSGHFFNYQNQPDDPLSLSQRTVSALFEDNQENLWVGTHRGGVNLYMPNTEKFTLYRQEPFLNSLSYNDVKAFCEDSYGRIWIGTDGGGLNLFDKKNNSFTHYKYSPYNATTIGSNEVLDIMEDSEGNLWIATWGGGLSLYNKSADNFTRFVNKATDKNSLSSNYVQKVFEDSKKNLWVATYFGGLNLFDRKTKKFTRIINGPTGKTALQGNNIISINEDRQGNLWIGTDDGGLNCLNATTNEFSHYFTNDEKKPDLRIIFVDSKGKLWVGQEGLYLFDAKQNTFSLYTERAGLSTEFIKGIVEDANENFWISTSNGITQFNLTNLSFKKYNTADGLQGLEFEANSFLKTKEGQIYFGGVNGFNVFNPQNIATNTFIPPVYVTDFQVFNKKIGIEEKGSPLQADISFTDNIKLSYKQSTFSFGFAALNYTASENNHYAYKLENWDKDWIYAGSEKKASYTNVSAGQYTFRVKASNNDGVWNEAGRSITIIITPPFWATWWFRSAVFVALVTGVILFYRFKRNLELQRLEEKKKEEIHQEQLQFFTNISHEFRTPLSLILGPVEKLQKENPQSPSHHYYKAIYRNTNRLMNLINELMDFRKSESGALKLNVMPGNIDSFLEEIADEFSELAQEKNIDFTISSQSTFSETWFDRQVLEKIVINLISNSFKYTADGGVIDVSVTDSLQSFTPSFKNELLIKHEFKGKQYMYVRVADNGIGISKESIAHLFERYYKISETHLGSGIGLAFVKSLTSLHKGNIFVYSERNKGTEIIIAIPCAKEDYTKDEKWVMHREISPRLESIHAKYELQDTAEDEKRIGDNDNGINNKGLILVADDNDELRHFLKESLAPHYKISEAVDGQSGFEKAKEEFPDLIISDVMMPRVNGIEFCRMVKEDIETSHIPFLMLTAKDAPESKLEGVESGADFYFSKPLSIELLELTIRNIFSQKKKLKERYLHDNLVEIKDQAQSSRDKIFLNDLIEVIESQLSNPEMNIAYVCTKMGMSRTKLFNKVKGVTGQSIGEFIRTIRLKKAAQLLTHADISITEVMYSVGVQTQSYFTKAFKNEFGKTPTQFLKDLAK